ncbi:hypothetical protein WJX81_002298 [Elliptochloris bilobata]|uniref:Uncharacterized protein n=1 Tax=Elliptochloris bilobata TaxID=381761 RepID=A0AAW1QHU3_9CHLO
MHDRRALQLFIYSWGVNGFLERRNARFSVIGLTLHGPLFYHGFRALDTHIGAAPTLRLAALKMLTGQLTLFPVYVTLFFVWSSALEGKAPRQALQKLRISFAPVFRAGWVFWPAANMINFLLVPPAGRVLYVNGAGLLWNTYLSYSNAAANARQEEVALAAVPP